MNRVTISVPHETDLNFRKKAAIKFAFKRGWYGRAVLEAMNMWITFQDAKEEGISDENKEQLWNTFREHMTIDSDNPEEILDYITKFFSSEIRIANAIDYELTDDKVMIKKEGSFEPLLSQLITKKDDFVVFNCPVQIMADAALKQLTGKEYIVKSQPYTIIEPETLKDSTYD